VDHYDRPALSFWDRFGAATVSRLQLAPGDRVLDLCCGAGASALPAARAVGAAGHVLGIDVAAPLLAMARDRAAAEGLANIEFRHGNATGTGLPDGGFDAVVCVFGVFFARDMTAFAAEMWRLVRPGGTLAVTTWGRACSSPRTGISGRPSAPWRPRCTRPTTRGTRSPRPVPWPDCSGGREWPARPPRPFPASSS
jgi:ubiquinone/menaquinone biosynthesis C-methylase UbiE